MCRRTIAGLLVVVLATVATTLHHFAEASLDISPPLVNFDCGPNTALPGIDLRLAPSYGVGGSVTPSPLGKVPAGKNAWPWMALVGDRSNGWWCGGSLINERWVLTAQQCITRGSVMVRLGEHDYSDDTDGAAHEDFSVTETIKYPEYKYPETYHDLALLKLDRRVQIKSTIAPVCLPWGKESSTDMAGKKVTLTGWGSSSFSGPMNTVLQQVDLTVFSSSECNRSYSTTNGFSLKWPRGFGSENMCAGDREGGKDACRGDSGSPIVSFNSAGRYTVAGIVSAGHGCGQKEFPGIYVNARHAAYLAWIKKVAF